LYFLGFQKQTSLIFKHFAVTLLIIFFGFNKKLEIAQKEKTRSE